MKTNFLKPMCLFLLILLLIGCSEKPYQFPEKYDPLRNPFDDLKAAVKVAQKSGQRIILKVGGEWCVWCHRLDDFIKQHQEIDKYLHSNFIFLKINVSKENKNEKFLAQYPKVPGYPHLFVLESNGDFLHSQDTAPLEKEKSYDAGNIMEFLKLWAPDILDKN